MSSPIRALFSGPSGTGKMLAAQFLAQKLKKPLYGINVDAIIKNYVGETEKRLHQLFDNAEDSGAILYFDEADPSLASGLKPWTVTSVMPAKP